jgi:radical SAM-linked protein
MHRDDGGAASEVSYRYAVGFAVEGDVRFCSHRDMIRLFERAFARAALPVRFSEGFNPHPRFSLLPPRPVGVATEADRLVVELTEALDPGELLQRLSETMPGGVSVLQARMLDPAERCQARLVTYVVALPGADLEDLPARVSRLVASPPVLVERKSKKHGKPISVDIHPYIELLAATEGGLSMTLRVSQEGTAKPLEVCAALGITDRAVHSWTRRVSVEWQ